MSIEKRDYTPRTLEVEAFGHRFEMRRVTAQEYIRLRRGGEDDELLEAAVAAVIDSSLPEGTEIDLGQAQELLAAWIRAHREEAVPQA